MGVEYTWLATDRADCVYVFWSDKLGAHPDTPCLEEAEPDEFDILHRLLDLEEEGCALYYAHPNESEPACYQRTGGRGDLKASDLPDTWARAARRIALPFDQAPDEIRITDHVEAVRDSDGMTEAETEAYFASRSLSWRIAMDKATAEPNTAYRAHLEQIAATLVFDAIQRAATTGRTLDLTSVSAFLADVEPSLDVKDGLARIAADTGGETTAGEMAMHEARIAVATLNDSFLERGANTQKILADLNERLGAEIPVAEDTSPWERADFHLVDVIAVPESASREYTWLAVDSRDRLFVFRAGKAGAHPAPFVCLDGHSADDTAAVREVLQLGEDPFLGPASYYTHSGSGEPSVYILDGGRGKLLAEALPSPWCTLARRLVLTPATRQPGLINVSEHVDLDEFNTLGSRIR